MPESATSSAFESEAEAQQVGLVTEFIDFLKHNKKWWLTPIILMLLLVMVVLIIGIVAPSAAPFIYTLF